MFWYVSDDDESRLGNKNGDTTWQVASSWKTIRATSTCTFLPDFRLLSPAIVDTSNSCVSWTDPLRLDNQTQLDPPVKNLLSWNINYCYYSGEESIDIIE